MKCSFNNGVKVTPGPQVHFAAPFTNPPEDEGTGLPGTDLSPILTEVTKHTCLLSHLCPAEQKPP